ncbi:DUF488 family protein [Ancylobacter sp.]|uniref:DUF488 domain-containing protein n=1 Tax=Ancylobacter sp. TaxID=1872567 RepID=UPI003D09C390
MDYSSASREYVMKEKFDIFSVGHSTHSLDRFLEMISNCQTNAIADVRSSPFSRYAPHFSRPELKKTLLAHRISYVFLGAELGGRPSQSSLFCDGVADYEAMAGTNLFKKGIERLKIGMQKHRITLMCSEQDPLDCHRCLLVSRALAEIGKNIGHIMSNGSIVDHSEIEGRLLDIEGRAVDDLFSTRSDRLVEAYRSRSKKVAFAEPGDVEPQACNE